MSLSIASRGTAIATFEKGRYPQGCATGYEGSCQHAALLVYVMPTGIWVMDQFVSEKRRNPKPRFIQGPEPRKQKFANGTWRNAGNNALAFSVIQ